MVVVLACVSVIFIFMLVMSILYVHASVEAQQRRDLITRAEYIQSYLRSLYYWDVTLTPLQADGLTIDLRDLSIDMQQDIHVYALNGELLASSSPQLFDGGILSRNMNPSKPFFSDDHIALFYEQIKDEPYLIAYLPFHNGAFVTIGYIAVPYFLSEQTRQAEVQSLLKRLIPAFLLALLFSLLVSYFATRSMTAPISMLTDKMRQFEIGGRDNHIEYPYHDELGALVERYNMLVDRVEESAEQLARAEREGAWRTMARQIAHEINNPLTPMKLSIQYLMRMKEAGVPGWEEKLESVSKSLLEQIDTLSQTASEFSSVSASGEDITRIELDALIAEQKDLYDNREDIAVSYCRQGEGDALVDARRSQLTRVLVNLLTNSVQAIENSGKEGGQIRITLSPAVLGGKPAWQFDVEDNGPGVNEADRAKLFTLNFTTKKTGTGLGLALSRMIIEQSQGTIGYSRSQDLGGARFTVVLPAASVPA